MNKITPARIRQLNLELDPEGMLNVAFDLGSQIRQMQEIASGWNLPNCSPKNILMVGIGGSAIGGDLVRTITEDKIEIPVVMCRDYEIPNFVNENTLAICVSYSGNTEETLQAYSLCRERGATIIAISTGGKMEDMARSDGITFCGIPKGYQPRAALGLSFTAQLIILSRLGLIQDYASQLSAAASMLDRIADKWKNWQDPIDNPPLKLASELRGRIPIIYGSNACLGCMAYRWKCQFNENSKTFAGWGVLPEMNHNEIVGWYGQHEFCPDRGIIFLRDTDNPPRIKMRLNLTREIISKLAPVYEIYPEGESKIEKLFYFILYGDLASIYLAYLNGKDPSDIGIINWLKDELAKGKLEVVN